MKNLDMAKIGSLGGKRSKRGPDSVESLVKRIKVVAEEEGKEVIIKVRRK